MRCRHRDAAGPHQPAARGRSGGRQPLPLPPALPQPDDGQDEDSGEEGPLGKRRRRLRPHLTAVHQGAAALTAGSVLCGTILICAIFI